MFEKFFKKKKKVPISDLSHDLLLLLWNHTKNFILQDRKNPKPSFHDIDERILIRELMTLSFWSLNFLDCPFNLWQATLNDFFRVIEIGDSEKQEMLRFMEERSRSYSDSWGKNSADFTVFAAEVSRNIDESLFLNMIAHLEVASFFTALTETNSNFLKHIKNDIEMVQ